MRGVKPLRLTRQSVKPSKTDTITFVTCLAVEGSNEFSLKLNT
jgi:hypothetical protein